MNQYTAGIQEKKSILNFMVLCGQECLFENLVPATIWSRHRLLAVLPTSALKLSKLKFNGEEFRY
jgi:hypothetical protein